MKNVLVTGGAGYIGSCLVKDLCNEGFSVLVIDNLSKGKKELVDRRAKFIEGDILDENILDEIFRQGNFEVVFHLAAAKDAGESMYNLGPYTNNIVGTCNILKMMDKYNVKKIIFSSTAAVYGEPQKKIIDENHQTNPINYYGFSKLECERVIKWYKKLKEIDYVILRYFNVAGDCCLNYIDSNAKNIFPIVAEAVFGQRDKLEVFGDNYNTEDGTCIRDYIHVCDISKAHILALNLNRSEIINLGSSMGFSVLEVIKEFEKLSNKKIDYKIVGRREGDPEILLASNKKAKELMGWRPSKILSDMVKSTIEAYKSGRGI